METFTANQAKKRFGEFIDRAQKAPVQVMRRNRVVGVMVSAKDYETMLKFYGDRLNRTLQLSAVTAAAAGLTPEKLDNLFADES
ncbi:MAG: type II toxin-antitoxin system Phd/YefM family antitoxin [Methyloversatilis sp.]|nr:type II toxin-antitoxin system Phd/YefM family antitoxin [Methyloversatilis sp.]